MVRTKRMLIVFLLAMTIVTPIVYGDTIVAYKRDAFFRFYGNPADHTYACVNGKCYAVGNSSRSGGRYVTGKYIDKQSGYKAICASNNYFVYARNGVCHQHTNRMLYYGKTVLSPGVQGYNLTKYVYGIYGDTGPFHGTFTKCRMTCGS